MTKILIVRQRTCRGFFPERFRGRADLPLTAEGRRQAEAAAGGLGSDTKLGITARLKVTDHLSNHTSSIRNPL